MNLIFRLGSAAGNGRARMRTLAIPTMPVLLLLLGMQVMGSSAIAAAPHEHAPPVVRAPGYFDLTYPAPEPGSYALPPLGAAADGEVLESDGSSTRLHDLLGDRVVVLSFMYTSCSDVNGCPLAAYVLARVNKQLQESEDLIHRVRLVSLSFDPTHDTPAVMKAYSERLRQEGVGDWRFLTTRGKEELEPLLRDYDQSVFEEIDARGNPQGTLAHILRVFLIDRERRIRNIYSISYLHADSILADIRTLLAEPAD